MKKVFLSFSLITAFALLATFSRRNIGNNADRFLTPNVSIFENNSSAPVAVANVSTTNVSSQTKKTSVPISKPKTVPAAVPALAPKTIPASTPKIVSVPIPAPKPVGEYKDGSYVGSVADAYYGNIQVKAIIQGGKLADVIFLQYPNDRRTSIEINTQAMPYLKSEAIQAQNANVDIVSGASDSSQAFRESLGTALAVAKN